MTIRERPYYWVECDRCGQKDDDEFSAWYEADQAVEVAESSGWWVEDGHHICPDCEPHPPDWDDEHEAAARGDADLDCVFCRA